MTAAIKLVLVFIDSHLPYSYKEGLPSQHRTVFQQALDSIIRKSHYHNAKMQVTEIPADIKHDSELHEVEDLQSDSDMSWTPEEEKKLVRKIDLYLLPTIWLMYLLSYMVRNCLNLQHVSNRMRRTEPTSAMLNSLEWATTFISAATSTVCP